MTGDNGRNRCYLVQVHKVGVHRDSRVQESIGLTTIVAHHHLACGGFALRRNILRRVGLTL